MLNIIRRFFKDESGASATEYAMLIVFVALAVAVGAQTLGSGINSLYSQIESTLSAITMPSP